MSRAPLFRSNVGNLALFKTGLTKVEVRVVFPQGKRWIVRHRRCPALQHYPAYIDSSSWACLQPSEGVRGGDDRNWCATAIDGQQTRRRHEASNNDMVDVTATGIRPLSSPTAAVSRSAHRLGQTVPRTRRDQSQRQSLQLNLTVSAGVDALQHLNEGRNGCSKKHQDSTTLLRHACMT